MKSQATSVSEYFAELPAHRQKALTTLRALIREKAPEAVESMQYGMASYELDGMLCALASQKNHMALYVCDPEVVEAHREALGKLNCGKGCIRFRKLADFPLDTTTVILREAYAQRRTAA